MEPKDAIVEALLGPVEIPFVVRLALIAAREARP